MQNGRLKTMEGERLLDYRGLRQVSQARPISVKKEEPGELDTASRYAQSFPFFAKVGLACKTRKEAVSNERLWRRRTPGS